MATVRDIVTDALKDLGVLAAGEAGAAAETEDGMVALNRLVDQWKAERLLIFAVTRTTFTITAGTQDYVVGSGAVVNVLKPIYMENVGVINTAVTPSKEIPLMPLTDDAWAAISVKTLTSPLPTYYYFDSAVVTGTPVTYLRLWPIPTLTTLTGVAYSPQQVPEFPSLSTVVSLPSGYRRMLVKNLALEMAPSYRVPVSKELTEQARESKAIVKRSNSRLHDLSIDPGALMFGGSSYDINVG